MEKSEYRKYIENTNINKCANCIFFEKRTGNYDGGHEQGKCINHNRYVSIIDLCSSYKVKK